MSLLSERDQDTVLIRALGEELDDEARWATAEENDNDTLHPEEMTPEQRSSLLGDELVCAHRLALSALNALQIIRIDSRTSDPTRRVLDAEGTDRALDASLVDLHKLIMSLSRAQEIR